ncbi:DUF3786 domain-containing protein [Chloroflexota bacterium]
MGCKATTAERLEEAGPVWLKWAMLIGEGQDWLDGEQRAWDILAGLNPKDVSHRSKAAYDELSGAYILRLFSEEVSVSPEDRIIRSNSVAADFLLNGLRHYSRLSLLWYLIQSKDIPLSGKLINPGSVAGGLIFSKGSHRLPLDKIAERYGNDISGFLCRGGEFGGRQLDYGDVSLRLFPFPRIPLVLLLWANDKEFPARADLLFDVTCSTHLPPDVIWSTAMLSILAML